MTTTIANTPVVILAGGKGARFDHESQVLPKPLIEVAGKPILMHIIDGFRAQGFHRFIVAAGYKIEEFYDGPNEIDRDEWWYQGFRFGGFEFTSAEDSILVVDTGLDSHTGARVARLAPYLNTRFVLTYGDGLSDVRMSDVIAEHERDYTKLSWCQYEDGQTAEHPAHYPPLVTLTAVNPPGRFGALQFNPAYDHHVRHFHEKGNVEWINGGFMICEPELTSLISDIGHDDPGFFRLESQVLPSIASEWRLRAHKHFGYWRCMDTRRDLEEIEADVARNGGKLPWLLDV